MLPVWFGQVLCYNNMLSNSCIVENRERLIGYFRPKHLDLWTMRFMDVHREGTATESLAQGKGGWKKI